MSTAEAATSNVALNPQQVKYFPDAQSIISTKYVDVQDAYLSILKNQLSPKVNDGKLVYWGIATKILDADSINYSSYDFFRKPAYDIERLDGISDGADLSSRKIVMAHVPGLFTLTSVYDAEENKQSNEMTPADVFKLPIETSLMVSRGDIIEIIFASPSDFSNPKILSALEKNDRRLKILSKRKDGISPIKAMADFAKCKLLQVNEPTGGALDNRAFLNPKAPSTGHLGTYVRAAQNYLPPQNLLSRTVRVMGVQPYLATLRNPGQIESIGANEIQLATNMKNLNIKFSFYAPDGRVSTRIRDRLALPELKSLSAYTNFIPFMSGPTMLSANGGFKSLAEGNDKVDADKMSRSVYLLVEVFQVSEESIFKVNQEEKFLTAAITYLTNIFQQEFKYGVKQYDITTSEATSNGFATNQNGSTSRFLQLDMMKNVNDAATPEEALKYDELAYNKNFSTDEKGVTTISPVVQQASGATKSNTSVQDQTMSIKNPLDECEDAEKLLEELYYKAKGNSALKYSNERIKRLHTFYKKIKNDPKKFSWVPTFLLPGDDLFPLELFNDHPMFVLALDLIDYFSKRKPRTGWGNIKSANPARSRFEYTAKIEAMSFPPELIKKQKKKPKGKKKEKFPLPPRGTNRDIMMGGSILEPLSTFYKELKKLIAANETTAKNRIVPEQIVIVPLKVFRPYQYYTKRRPYHDRNSRHFYNRAIDFCVFIVNNKNAEQMSGLQEIPTENVYQIPADVVYLYVLKLNQLTNNAFDGGLALFTRGNKINFEYNHYEYMALVPNSVEVVKKRRWCNPPKKSEKKLLIGRLWKQPAASKDDIVRSWVTNNYISEVSGEPPQKIQFLIE